MERQTFSDIDKKKGSIGSTVIEVYLDREHGEKKTVKQIITKGRAGTRIYFEEGGYGNPSNYRIV